MDAKLRTVEKHCEAFSGLLIIVDSNGNSVLRKNDEDTVSLIERDIALVTNVLEQRPCCKIFQMKLIDTQFIDDRIRNQPFDISFSVMKYEEIMSHSLLFINIRQYSFTNGIGQLK